MKIAKPELKVVRFGSEDVIATSIGIMTADAYRASFMNDPYSAGPGFEQIDDGYTGYMGVYGQMTSYSDEAQGWYFYSTGSYKADDATMEYLRNNYSNEMYDLYVPDLGYSNTMPYTKGASYYELQ